jgi:CheY-like chemotaxis protein
MPKEFTPRAVLVIDGEPLIQWAVSEALSQAGYEVVTESDGDGGIRVVATTAPRPFDVIFLDFRLPDA